MLANLSDGRHQTNPLENVWQIKRVHKNDILCDIISYLYQDIHCTSWIPADLVESYLSHTNTTHFLRRFC